MRGRLIEPFERWLFDGALLALAIALVWRLAAGFFLWGGRRLHWPPSGIIDSQLLVLLALAALLVLGRCLVPRDYSGIASLLLGGAAGLHALAIVPRHGWLLEWPLGSLAPGWYVFVLLLCAAALLCHALLVMRWLRQLRGHGIEWTKQWAVSRPYAARVVGLRALRLMGDWETK